MFAISKKAIKQIKRISDDEGVGDYSIRLTIIGKGAEGYEMSLSFDNIRANEDEVINSGDIQTLIHKMYFPYFQKTTLDYSDGPIGSGFKFNTENSVNKPSDSSNKLITLRRKP